MSKLKLEQTTKIEGKDVILLIDLDEVKLYQSVLEDGDDESVTIYCVKDDEVEGMFTIVSGSSMNCGYISDIVIHNLKK